MTRTLMLQSNPRGEASPSTHVANSPDRLPTKLDSQCLDQLFLKARTHKAWTDRPVSDQQLRELYDLSKMGPTSANTCPARFVWVKSAEGKSKLAATAMAMPTNPRLTFEAASREA
jgi:hypothetical protein